MNETRIETVLAKNLQEDQLVESHGAFFPARRVRNLGDEVTFFVDCKRQTVPDTARVVVKVEVEA